MADLPRILPVMVVLILPSLVLTRDIFKIQSTEKTLVYEELKPQSLNLTYRVDPWPPDWRPNSTFHEPYRDVTVQLYNRTTAPNTLLCQARYNQGKYVDESESDSCYQRSGGRIENYRQGYGGVFFTVINVHLGDMGGFILVLTDSNAATYRGTYTLNVQALRQPQISVSKTGDLEEGEQVTLNCVTQNVWPPPDLQWKRGPILESENHKATTWWGESSARVDWTTRKEDHNVAFFCTSKNIVGVKQDSHILYIRFRPQVKILQCRADKPYAVKEGQSISLSSNIEAYPGVSKIEWYTPKNIPMGVNNTRVDLGSLNRTQAGDYTCTAHNVKGTGEHKCYIDVQYGVTVKLPQQVTYKEFQSVTISCDTESNPQAIDYTWTKDGDSDYHGYNKTIEFTSVRPEHGGLYTCEATNLVVGATWMDHASIELVVEYKPRLANYSITKFGVYQGRDTILECRARAYPSPEVSWRFKGGAVTDGPRHKISSDQSASKLQIRQVVDADYGSYSCDVTNQEGQDKFVINLLKPGKPDPPQECDVTTVGDREVTLTCVPGYNGGEQLAFKVSRSPQGQGSEAEVEVTWPEGYSVDKGQTVTLKVKGFGPNTNYTLQVYGDNKFGRSDLALLVLVSTADGPPLPTSPPPNVGAIVGGVFGGLLVILIIVGAAVYYRKYGAPDVPIVMRRKKDDSSRNIMNRHSDDLSRMHAQRDSAALRYSENYDVGQRYAEIEDVGQRYTQNDVGRRYAQNDDIGQKSNKHTLRKDGMKHMDTRQNTAEPNQYILHPANTSEYHAQINTGHAEYTDYDNHGNPENEAAVQGYYGEYYGYEDGYGYANYGFANDESFDYGSEARGNQYIDTSTGYANIGPNSDNNRQVAAEVYRERPEDVQHQQKPQSNLAGMGALAGSHVLLHQQIDNDRAEDARKRISHEPLMEHLEGRFDYPRHQLSFREKLGEGLFGEVWRVYAENMGGRRGRLNVAVKMIKDSCPPEERSSLWRELEVLKMLRPHPNVVALLGACSEKDPLLVILEYCSKGNLLDFLRTNRTIPRGLHPAVRGVSLTTRALTCFVMQIANGMEYISTNGLLHRDLAARNILLDDRLACKISDFGFARDIAHTRQYEGKTQRRLPLRWMAPESLYDCMYSTQSDVWAFGICIWEVMTLGSSPYPGMTGHDVMELINTGFRMEKPLHCSSSMYAVMRDCWRPAAQQRPNWPSLSMRIAAILEDLDDNPDEIIPVNDMEGSMFEILQDPPGEKC